MRDFLAHHLSGNRASLIERQQAEQSEPMLSPRIDSWVQARSSSKRALFDPLSACPEAVPDSLSEP